MKVNALVMELRENSMVILTKDGEFKEVVIPAKKPRIGDYIDVEIEQVDVEEKRRKVFIPIYKFASIASIFILLIIGTLILNPFNKPVVAVALDINPSVEFYLNQKGLVSKTSAYNSDGQKILDQIDVEGLPLVEAIETFIKKSIDEQYLSPTKDNLIYISFTKIDQDAQLPEILDIENNVEQVLQEEKLEGNLVLEEVSVTEWEEAKENNISVNKLNVIKKLPTSIQAGVKEKANDLSISNILDESRVDIKMVVPNVKHITSDKKDKDDSDDNEDESSENKDEDDDTKKMKDLEDMKNDVYDENKKDDNDRKFDKDEDENKRKDHSIEKVSEKKEDEDKNMKRERQESRKTKENKSKDDDEEDEKTQKSSEKEGMKDKKQNDGRNDKYENGKGDSIDRERKYSEDKKFKDDKNKDKKAEDKDDVKKKSGSGTIKQDNHSEDNVSDHNNSADTKDDDIEDSNDDENDQNSKENDGD
ncbi:hypothetical protein BHF71_05000 [Vulcanibacillus modesticaldus]|uniref:RsgI N-terminal anti-sigma domain-containing protein n=1 Tax=Vulcanibacillus modesticaldus TaxID=337097 RepID=A0A1D2YRU6_9BACI|nr:anti-sigma factor domain-containing protein [Vulcanibacillus modesticaldus]OEF95549.1 hypothetical protein BHF71_05000 [Vulcanibacillus modesticaldus]